MASSLCPNDKCKYDPIRVNPMEPVSLFGLVCRVWGQGPPNASTLGDLGNNLRPQTIGNQDRTATQIAESHSWNLGGGAKDIINKP